ncbi:MAG TPA: zinc-ribbon domain containing protein [Polyangia bacterium]|jgi:hypothetical protein
MTPDELLDEHFQDDVAPLPPSRALQCKACDDFFTFSGEEQLYFRERELHTPNHCPRCRAARRRAVELGLIPERPPAGQ